MYQFPFSGKVTLELVFEIIGDLHLYLFGVVIILDLLAENVFLEFVAGVCQDVCILILQIIISCHYL